MLARLQEELSRLRYSEHGLLAVIRADSGWVCQSLIVSSYCSPGSAHSQAACAILRNRFFASTVSRTSPVRRASKAEGFASLTARMDFAPTPAQVLAVLD